MKNNKGFTLVEILAVVTILAILAGLASLAVTRYRKDVENKDLINLHSAITTSFSNYRSVLAQTGDELPSGTFTISKNVASEFDKYISELSYNGERLTKEHIDGSSITVATKEGLLGNSEYIEYVKSRIKNFDTLSAEEKERKIEEKFTEDSACAITATACKAADYSETARTSTDAAVRAKYEICKWVEPEKKEKNEAGVVKNCKLDNPNGGKVASNMLRSQEELICLSVWYKGTHIINDKNESGGAKSLNVLCQYTNTDDNAK